MSRRTALWVCLAVAALTAGPPLATLAEQGSLGAFRYLSADAFYYLTVADRSAGAAFFSFDGVHPTNGFHPLWQWLLTAGFAARELTPEQQVRFSLLASSTLVTLGTALYALAILRRTRRPWLALLASVPGFWFLLVPRFNPHMGAAWSWANGMESALSIFFCGVLLTAWRSPRLLGPAATTAGLLVSSLLITLLTLSRLDDVFLFAPFLLLLFATAASPREGLRRTALASLPPLLMIGAYLVYNLAMAGSLLPSSGAAKAQPLWGLLRNGYALLTTLAPFLDFREGPDVWASEAWRVLQMVLPALVALGWLVTQPFPRARGECDAERWRNAPLAILAGYTALKCGYNFAMVGLWHQGEWYYPLCILTFNALLACALADALDRPTRLAALVSRWPRPVRTTVASVVALAVPVVAANGFVALKRDSDRHERLHAFWLERGETATRLAAACPDCGVLSFDDGIVAFSLEEAPTLNGLGLSMDAEAQRALAEGRLLELAWRRGHRILVSVSYPMPEQAYTSPASLHRHLSSNRHMEREDLARWQFEVAFRSRETGVPFVRFGPRDPER